MICLDHNVWQSVDVIVAPEDDGKHLLFDLGIVFLGGGE